VGAGFIWIGKYKDGAGIYMVGSVCLFCIGYFWGFSHNVYTLGRAALDVFLIGLCAIGTSVGLVAIIYCVVFLSDYDVFVLGLITVANICNLYFIVLRIKSKHGFVRIPK
jgi:hypothetical protein